VRIAMHALIRHVMCYEGALHKCMQAKLSGLTFDNDKGHFGRQRVDSELLAERVFQGGPIQQNFAKVHCCSLGLLTFCTCMWLKATVFATGVFVVTRSCVGKGLCCTVCMPGLLFL